MEQPTAWIAGWEHTAVQGEQIDRVGLPFTPELFAHGMPAVVTEGAAAVLPPTTIQLDRISGRHGRSYELGNAKAPTAIWEDQYGNAYTSLSYKGNNFTKPDIIHSLTAPSGFIPYGLQEDDALLRVIRSSRLLRENGIATEWIVGVTEPATMPYIDEPVTQHEYKKRWLEDILSARPIKEAGEIAQAIAPMTFFVTERCMEINDRPLDFLDDTTSGQIQARLQKVFTVYNVTHRRDADFRELSADSNEDRRYYFTTLLPTLQGRNLARLHNAQLVHKFPVPGNTTALGGVIDLDSIHGEPLGFGDRPITFQDMRHDIEMAFEGGHTSYMEILRHIATTTGWFEDVYERMLHIQQNFLNTYRQNSSRLFDDKEKCAMFLSANKDGYLLPIADELYHNIRAHLATSESLCDNLSEELPPLVEHDRERRSTIAEAYTACALDACHEESMVPREARTDFVQYLCGRTMVDMETAMTSAVSRQLADGGTSEAFDTLVQMLGLTEEADKGARITLAWSFLTPHTVFKRQEQEPLSAHLELYATTVSAAISQILRAGVKGFTALNLGFEDEPADNGEHDSLIPLDDHYYYRIPYRVVTAVGLDALTQRIAEAEDAGCVIQVHDTTDDDTPESTIMTLPVTQYITDASAVSVHKTVSPDGHYRHRRITSPDATYMAAVSILDETGVVHISMQRR